MRAPVQFHIHVNCFTSEIPDSVSLLALERLIHIKECKIKRNDRWEPLWIATRKSPTESAAARFLDDAVSALERDPTMRGYVECEEVVGEFVQRLPETPYRRDAQLPHFNIIFKNEARYADIHVFRSIDTPYDCLDDQLEQAGFYVVTMEKQRIWTLLLGQNDCNEQIFKEYLQHFQSTGGVSKIELEKVRTLKKLSTDFQLPPVGCIVLATE